MPSALGRQLENCFQHPITDSIGIKEELIGDWELIWNGCGECSNIEQLGGTVTFSDSTGVLLLSKKKEDVTPLPFTWCLVPITKPSEFPNSGYQLKTVPSIYALSITTFCEQFIHFSHAQRDGGTYLFQKKG